MAEKTYENLDHGSRCSGQDFNMALRNWTNLLGRVMYNTVDFLTTSATVGFEKVRGYQMSTLSEETTQVTDDAERS